MQSPNSIRRVGGPAPDKTKRKAVLLGLGMLLVIGGVYFLWQRISQQKGGKLIKVSQEEQPLEAVGNAEGVSPISGVQCENWNRRPYAFMQPADVPARPLAGLSEADMVFEMQAVYGSITRLMGVYVCATPEEVGSLRSARHDFVHIAKSLDAIYVHWGRADIEQFKDVLNSGLIDNMNCNNDAGKSAEQYCFRKDGMNRGVDTGYSKFATIIEGAKKFGYRQENKFVGYPHQAEAPLDQRPTGGHLRVAYAGPFAAEYDYDRESNTFLRTWGDTADTDRNTGKRVAPKNIAVLIADAAPIKVGEQYVNVQIGDPWYDQKDTGDAYYYMNGQQYRGTWKKDKGSVESKLLFLDASGKEIKFVPGQIWVEIIDPGQNHKWQPGN